VAIYYQNASEFNLTNVTAQGGNGSTVRHGQNGTVYVQQLVAGAQPAN
jgi:hypothetical protein